MFAPLLSVVTAINESHGQLVARCQDGTIFTKRMPQLLPSRSHPAQHFASGCRSREGRASADIGFGNVVKILLRFTRKSWTHCGDHDLSELSFLFSRATVPVWWTQHPCDFPLLTGWFAGPKADAVAQLTVGELVNMGIGSLAEIFNLPPDRITRDLITSQAINWGNKPFARGAYSYATPKTRQAQTALRNPMKTPYSFLAKHCTPAGIWAPSRRRWQPARQQRRQFWPPDHKRVQPGPREDRWQNSVARKSPHI